MCVRACVHACVCVSVATLAAELLISTLELNYKQLYHGILFIFNSWILIKMLRLEVMASFATPHKLWRYIRIAIEVTSHNEASVSSIGRLLLVLV